MLPFLGRHRTQTILHASKKEGEPMQMPEAEHPVVPAMEDFARAHLNGDHQGMAKAFHAAHQIMAAMPQEEEEKEEKE